MNNEIDPNKYVSIGVHPNDVPELTAEEIAALDKKLAMTPQERTDQLVAAFEAAMKVAEERESKSPNGKKGRK